MGVVGSLCHVLFFRIFPVLVVFVAAFFGWICNQTVPEAVFFATIFPLLGGHYQPATIFGAFPEPLVKEVPADLAPASRPSGEMFLKMPSGGQMPANGIGMCCRPAAYDPESVRRAVLWYLLQGGRHIDTADAYWNHNAIGEAMKMAEKRGIPRSEIFLTTKIMPSYFGTESTNATVHRFIKELGVGYIDLVLMHAPSFPIGRFGECKERPWKDCRTDTWRALSALRDQGLIRDVGVSNFAKKHLQEITSLDKAPIAANQFEFHPWAADWQFEAFKYCHEHSIAVTAYYSLGGFLSKAQTETVQTMNDITTSTGKSTQQVLLRWALQKNVSVIPGTSNPKHMKENLDLYSWKLTDEDMARLDKLRSDPNRIKFFSLEEDQS